MKPSEKNKNNSGLTRQPKLQEIEPGSTPLNFAGCEDQPRLHNTAYRKQKSFAVYAVSAAFPGSGRGTC